jgi:hypothetical protein
MRDHFPLVIALVGALLFGCLGVYDFLYRPHPAERCKALCSRYGGDWLWNDQTGCSCGTFVVPR